MTQNQPSKEGDETYEDEILVAFREAMAVKLRGFFGSGSRNANRFTANFYEEVYQCTYLQEE